MKEVVPFIHEAAWVAPPLGQDYRPYTSEEKAHFAADLECYLKQLREISLGVSHTGSQEQRNIRQYMQNQMETKLSNPGLEKVLTPTWPVGCRRILILRRL